MRAVHQPRTVMGDNAMRRLTVVLALLVAAGALVRADALPIAGPIPSDKLREDCRQLLDALDKAKAPLPAGTEKELKALLEEKVEDDAEFSVGVQRLLDAHCLIGVSINPESRVKAARGPAEAKLTVDRETVLLIK